MYLYRNFQETFSNKNVKKTTLRKSYIRKLVEKQLISWTNGNAYHNQAYQEKSHWATLREKEKRWNENSLVIIIHSKLIRS